MGSESYPHVEQGSAAPNIAVALETCPRSPLSSQLPSGRACSGTTASQTSTSPQPLFGSNLSAVALKVRFVGGLS